MNNKGVIILTYVLGELALVVLLIVIFSNFMKTTSNQEFMTQVVTAEDIARTLDIAQATPYNFKYEYPETRTGYTIYLDGISVSLLADGEKPVSGFSFKKRYFTVNKGVLLPSTQEIDASDFYILKEDSSLRLGDFTSANSVKTFSVPIKNRPNLSIIFEKSTNLAVNRLLEKLSNIIKSEAQIGFSSGQSNKITIKLSSHEKNIDNQNIIYYSVVGEIDTKPIAERLQEILENELNLLIVPLAKNTGQEKFIEINLINSFENINLFDESDYQRRFGNLVIQAFNKYYGVN